MSGYASGIDREDIGGGENYALAIAAATAALSFAATCAAAVGWLITEKFRDGHATSLGAASGIVAGLVYPTDTLVLDGGCVYLFTDGLTESEAKELKKEVAHYKDSFTVDGAAKMQTFLTEKLRPLIQLDDPTPVNPLAVFLGHAARAQHDGDVGMVATDALSQLDAAHLRHREIAHHDVDVRRIR